MDNHVRLSLFKRSVKHIVFVSIALLALLPLLALTRIGLLVLQAKRTVVGISGEVAMLGAFCAFSLAVGVWLLLRLIAQLQQIADQGRQIHKAAFDAGNLNWIMPDTQTERDVENRQNPHQRPQSQNELESLTSALGRLHSDISTNLNRMRDQAFFLENLEIVLENCRDMVIMVNEKQYVVFSNRVAKHELGIMPERELRHALAESLLAGADFETAALAFESWDEHDEEMEITRIDGSSLRLHLTSIITRQHDASAKVLTKILLLRDITDRKRLEAQLYRSEKLASLGQLISGVAHELNNPLAAILGFAEMCRGTTDKEEIARNLEVIDREARRTAHIVENLLNFSRMRSPQRVLIDVHELAERCFNLLAYNFRTRNVQLRRKYDTHLPELDLDEYQMQQVLMNIILNAVQAMEAAETGNREIAATTHLSADGRFAVIEIADNGPGIATENLNRVFEPFFTTKKTDQGTGLGLSVSLSIVKGHGGTIVVDSRQGEGCCFKILLPLATADATSKTGTRTPTVRKQLKGHVLVVDDEPSVLAMTEKILVKTGLTVTATTSLKEAQQALACHGFDLVLADMHMPDGSGTEVWKYVQTNQPQLAGKVIFMTGDPRIGRELATTLGINPHLLLKPFHVNDLRNAVDRCLTSRPQPREQYRESTAP